MDVKAFLDQQYLKFHDRDFILTDPIQIPHRYSLKEDIEIASLLTCTIAWGQRISIIRNAGRLMDLMDNSPNEFITGSSQKEWARFAGFVHRTFQPADLFYFLDAIRHIYADIGGLETVFSEGYRKGSVYEAIIHFRTVFLAWEPLQRTGKHVSNPEKGSAAKRLNLFLMWMCRPDDLGIHFGLWDFIPASELMIPLDIHVGRVARQLGILERKTNDWKAASELTGVLKEFDPNDPVKYDFSLFGTGLENKA